MRFHEHLVSSFIPDFVEIQRKSFSALLKKGIIKELSNRNPITNATHDLELFFFPQYYQLNRPECTPTEAILKSKSYSCKLYVPAQLTNRQTNEIKLQWVLLGNLPLMTKRGHFLINGSPRVVINQLVRSPGIYYQELIDIKKKKTYYADLISFRGAWLRLEIDKKRRVWARMKKTPKISALVFLQALGFTREQIKTGIRFSEFLENSYLKENHPDTTEQALISLYEKSHPTLSKTHSKKEKSQVTPIMGQKFLFRKFMNPRTYNLGLLGRMRLNKKFGLLISDKQLTLTRHDIFCAIDYLINLKHGLTTVDDIDNLKNRRVKASGELIQNQLSTGLIRLEKTIREKMKKVKKGLTIHSLITTKPINGALREFFGSSPLSQYLDQTNPLAEITHKRRLSSLGPGGISRETAGMAIRGIHPTHYGRICPIETPEGRNAGLVNSITIHARISSHGFIKTPFYNVYQGQIQKQDSSLRDARPIFFSAEQEERVKVAPGDLKASKLNFLPINNIPIRIGKEYHRVSREHVEYIAMSPIQMISIATSLIPFLEHDDANRALMGSNMQRQAVPIISPERPIVGTGLEARVAADSGHVVQSKSGGYVSYASGKKIIILEKDSINIFSNKLKSNVSQESNFENNFVNKLHKANSDKLLTKTKFETKNTKSGSVSLWGIQIEDLYGLTSQNKNSIFVKAMLKEVKVGKPVFRYKKCQKIKNFRLLSGSKGAYKNLTKIPFLSQVFVRNLIFQGKPRKGFFGSPVSKNKLYFLQKTETLNNLPSQESYKFFNVKTSSLINLIFISLNQFTNFSQNCRSNTDKKSEAFFVSNDVEQTILKQTLNKNFVFVNGLSGFVSPNKKRFLVGFHSPTSYLSLKKSVTHSLRSTYKNNRFSNTDKKSEAFFVSNDVGLTNLKQTSNKPLLRTMSCEAKVCRGLSGFVSLNKSFVLVGFHPLSFLQEKIQNPTRTKFLFETNLITNLDKFIRIQDYTNKLYLLITSERLTKNDDKKSEAFFVRHFLFQTLFEKKRSETFKSKKMLEDNLKIPLQTRLSKFLTRKKVVKTNIQLKQEKINKVFSYFNRFTHKSFVDYVENSKKKLFWGPLPDRKLHFAKNSKNVLEEKFFASTPSNTAESGVKQSIKERPTLTEKSETNLKQTGNKNLTKIPNVGSHPFETKNAFHYLSGSVSQVFVKGLSGFVDICEPKAMLASDVRNHKIKPLQYSLQNYQRSNQDTCLAQRPSVLEGEWVQKGDLLADCTASVSGDLSLGKNILVAYMPWEGYNFEDAILISERLVYDDIYTSLHIERYEIEIRDTKFGVEQISNQIPEVNLSEILHLDEKGVAIIGSWVKEGNILVGKVTPIQKKSLSPHEKLLYDIVGKKIPTTRNTSLRVPKGVEGKVINVEILETENIPPGITFDGPGRVHIYLAEKRKIQVGDKISGRHGNKGIVSKIIPRQDMPYLPNGTPIDMVLNPLGVPSRMNVGQVFEALLGLAGLYLNQSFKIPSFDETYGSEASRSIIYSKLYEARLKTGQKWLFDPNFPGKTRLFDGRTGQCFDQLVTVGQPYMLKLVHLVDDKIHARSTGPYSLVTQQPLGGRSKHGGQRLGEMEVWALEGFGAAYTLQELLTIKSDDIQGRHQVINAILTDAPITLGTPESFKVLIRELQSLCLDLDIYTIGSMGRATPMDVMKLP